MHHLEASDALRQPRRVDATAHCCMIMKKNDASRFFHRRTNFFTVVEWHWIIHPAQVVHRVEIKPKTHTLYLH